MMRKGWILLAVAAAVLQGCGREPVQTRVEAPRNSLPDAAVLRGPVAAAPAAPASAVPPAPEAPTAAAPAPAPAPAAAPATPPASATVALPSAPVTPPVAQGALPDVRDPGDPQGAQLLAQRPLMVPVVGIAPQRLADNYEQSRGARKHEAIDIMAPSGTPVVAVDDGRITKLFTSKPGGFTIYQYDPSGKLAYYYAHLQRYADGLREGQEVRRGDVIGYVGVSGNSDPNAPHLHFAVFRLGDPPKWWQGEAVNPYPALSRAAPSEQVAAR